MFCHTARTQQRSHCKNTAKITLQEHSKDHTARTQQRSHCKNTAKITLQEHSKDHTARTQQRSHCKNTAKITLQEHSKDHTARTQQRSHCKNTAKITLQEHSKDVLPWCWWLSYPGTGAGGGHLVIWSSAIFSFREPKSYIHVSWVRIPPEQLFFLFGEKIFVWVSCLALFSIYRS